MRDAAARRHLEAAEAPLIGRRSRSRLLLYEVETRTVRICCDPRHAAVAGGAAVEPTASLVCASCVKLADDATLFSYLAGVLEQLRPQQYVEHGTDGAVAHAPVPFCGGLVGYLGYEMRHEAGASAGPRGAVYGHGTERRIETGPGSWAPSAAWLVADRVVAVDHDTHAVHLLSLYDAASASSQQAAMSWIDETTRTIVRIGSSDAPPRTTPRPDPPAASDAAATAAALEITPAQDRAEYMRSIASCMDSIVRGESYELCLTTQLHCADRPDPLVLHRLLRRQSAAPYGALLRFGEAVSIASSSPECFMEVTRDGRVQCRPIKGTARRGANEAEDAALRAHLASNAKDFAENLMIVDLTRHDLGSICVPQTVTVPQLMSVETYATVHQLVTTVRGRLRSGLGAVDALSACFPPGSCAAPVRWARPGSASGADADGRRRQAP